jgi:hypothetical protein
MGQRTGVLSAAFLVVLASGAFAQDNAEILSIDAPSTGLWRTSIPLRARVKNSGTTIWRWDAGYMLGTENPGDQFPPSADVNPGDTYEFVGSLFGQHVGSTSRTFQMKHNGIGFGTTQTVVVQVLENPNSDLQARLVRHSVPDRLAPGQTCYVLVWLQNTGAGLSVWDPRWDILGPSLGNAVEVTTASSLVGPQIIWRTILRMKVPDVPGTYPVRLRMAHQGDYFGDEVRKDVQVYRPASSIFRYLDFATSPPPSTLQTTGTAAWQPDGTVRLTGEQPGQTGRAWLPILIPPADWDAEFNFRVGSSTEGFTFACLRDFDYPATSGPWLDMKGARGWAVEFDPWYSRFPGGATDPFSEWFHIAIIANSAENHLAFNRAEFYDNQWHHCVVHVRERKVTVQVDTETMLSSIPVPAAEGYERIGFTAANGETKSFWVDDFLFSIAPSLGASNKWPIYR